MNANYVFYRIEKFLKVFKLVFEINKTIEEGGQVIEVVVISIWMKRHWFNDNHLKRLIHKVDLTFSFWIPC